MGFDNIFEINKDEDGNFVSLDVKSGKGILKFVMFCVSLFLLFSFHLYQSGAIHQNYVIIAYVILLILFVILLDMYSTKVAYYNFIIGVFFSYYVYLLLSRKDQSGKNNLNNNLNNNKMNNKIKN